jgi:glycosyltransferase involved in cell wall biosynthesis
MTDSIRDDALNLQLYFSPLHYSARVLRMARALLREGKMAQVVLIGYREGDLSASEQLEPGLVVERLGTAAISRRPRWVMRALLLIAWTIRVQMRFGRTRPRLLIAHSLAALPATFLLARRTGAPLIYDAHELESERNGWPGWLRRVARRIERPLARRADLVQTTNDVVAEWYRDTYGLARIAVVRNLPDVEVGKPVPRGEMRRRLDLPTDAFIVCYQGMVGPGRGLPFIIEAFQGLPDDMHLVIIGRRTKPITLPHSDDPNIHFVPLIPPDKLASWTVDADVGLCLIEDTSLSYRYCLPNKLFEYLHAGVRVIASDLPLLREYVELLSLGEVIPWEPAAFRAALLNARAAPRPPRDPETLRAYSWSAEAPRFLNVVSEVLERAESQIRR